MSWLSYGLLIRPEKQVSYKIFMKIGVVITHKAVEHLRIYSHSF